jgi:hypothetical protein
MAKAPTSVSFDLRPRSDSPPPSYDSISELCDICAPIDFNRYLYEPLPQRNRIGRWEDILARRRCPFCRLVVRALTINPHRRPQSLKDEIILDNDVSWELGVEMSPYDQLTSEAYSNKFDLRSKAKGCDDVAYRFVVFIENNSDVKGFIQYLALEERDRKNRQFFGRRVDRGNVSTDLLISWLKRCDHFHGDVCEENGLAGRRLPKNLRLIDVKDGVIIKASLDKELSYLTLSYVWGTEDMQRQTGMSPVVTNLEDIQVDEDGDECTPLPKLLPQTIEDAIWLTNALGFQYLWVDALCIIQDEADENKKLHLSRMDAVYNCSTFMIAAASGSHANSGISGVSVPRQHSQCLERVNGMQFATMSPSFSDLENSYSLVWNTRGWTFQEKILAKRILLFTDYQVYFRCSESIWTEEIMMETGRLSKSIEARSGKYRWAGDRRRHVPTRKALFMQAIIPQLRADDEWSYLGKFPDYTAAIREYTQRTMTQPADSFVAIEGVLRTLERDTGKFLRGLPSQYFAQSLLWYPEPGALITRVNFDFPTWSWASWQFGSCATYDVLDVRVLRTVIITLRNMFIRLGKILGKVLEKAFENDGADSTSPSSSSSLSHEDPSMVEYSASPENTDTSTSSTAAPSPSPFHWPKFKKRDWSTRTIMGKAAINVATCFGWPMAIRRHTVKQMYLCDAGKVTHIKCNETLALKTFASNEPVSENPHARNSKAAKRQRSRSTHRYHSRLAHEYKFPVLSFETVIVQFHVGKCIGSNKPTNDNESSVFELLNPSGLCVGEIWTTLKTARLGTTHPLDFLTISWGLSLSIAEIDDEYIPRWTFDAAKLPESFMWWRDCLEEVFRPTPGKTLAGSYGGIEDGMEQPSLMQFFDALFRAVKGQPRPKFLWSTVNLVGVEWDEDGDREVARRVGMGRVVFNAWREQWGEREEVIFA